MLAVTHTVPKDRQQKTSLRSRPSKGTWSSGRMVIWNCCFTKGTQLELREGATRNNTQIHWEAEYSYCCFSQCWQQLFLYSQQSYFPWSPHLGKTWAVNWITPFCNVHCTVLSTQRVMHSVDLLPKVTLLCSTPLVNIEIGQRWKNTSAHHLRPCKCYLWVFPLISS